ncbi:MAG TPA: hypothetical protein VF874_07880, partial [Mycobacterium sp.]
LACCGALIGAAMCAMPGVGAAHAAPGEWAAIAYDPDGRTGWPNPGFAVWVNHAAGQREAVAGSLGQCSSGPGFGGSSAPCELVALVQDGCVALVSLDGVAQPAAAVAPTAQGAVDAAAAGHRVTEVIYNDCTY